MRIWKLLTVCSLLYEQMMHAHIQLGNSFIYLLVLLVMILVCYNSLWCKYEGVNSDLIRWRVGVDVGAQACRGGTMAARSELPLHLAQPVQTYIHVALIESGLKFLR